MTYVMSDIHGHYELYKKMLSLISFSDDDTLFVLGDILDRGPQPFRILKDMSLRPNVFPIMGNHEHVGVYLLRKLNTEITAENAETHLTATDLELLSTWLTKNGGDTTLADFKRLPPEERGYLLEYFDEFTPYEDIEVAGKRFVLVHGGLPNFSEEKPLDAYNTTDMLYEWSDYSRRYFSDAYLVTGHIPTQRIAPDHGGEIYMKHGHIAIDCGAAYGGRLGCVRLDDLTLFFAE